MLTRLYIDNYRAFSNFELLNPGSLVLFVGGNGTGKSSVLDVLRKLRAFVGEDWAAAGHLFPQDSRTRWDKRTEQIFSIALDDAEDKAFEYRLVLEHADLVLVKQEELICASIPVFRFFEGKVTLYGEDGTARPSFPAKATSTGVKGVPDQAMPRLAAFRKLMRNVLSVRINPFTAGTSSVHGEVEHLSQQGRNFSSWYADKLQSYPQGKVELDKVLADTIEGFASLILPRKGDQRVLMARIGTHTYDYEELSDGQRCLIILHAILCFPPAPTLLCIDEPTAFVSLREIQPWTHALRDWCDDNKSQAFLTTHNSLLIDHIGGDHGIRLHRGANQPVQQQPLSSIRAANLKAPLSEILSLGWEDDAEQKS